MTFIAPEERRTDRFVLRSFLPDDGSYLVDAVPSSYLHLIRFLPWPKADLTLEEATETVRRFRGRWLANEDFVVSIWSPDQSRLLGGTGFHLWEGPLDQGRAEIGMWIRSDVAGTGLGRAVLIEMLEWGFTEWPFMRLSWKASTLNLASIRVAERAGMVHEGVARRRHSYPNPEEPEDLALYAAFKGEWIRPESL